MKPQPSDPPRSRDQLRDRLVFGVLAVLALVPRLMGLETWWLNPDEGIYYSILTRADFAGFWAEVSANAHPPLYYLLLRGLGGFTWDFLAFRLFSVACGILAVLAIAAVAREAAGRGMAGAVAAAVAGTTMALAPGAIELSQVMRPYTLQLCLLSVASLALFRYRTEPSTRALVVYAASTSAALLTHYASGLAVGALGLTVVALGTPHRRRDPDWRRLFWAHLVPGLVVVAMYVVHIRPLAGSALADEALDGWLSFYMVTRPADAWLGFLGFQHLLAGPWLRGPIALLTLSAFGLAARRAPILSLLGAMSLVMAIAAAALGIYPLGSTRHTVWLAFATVPALGWLAGQLVEASRTVQLGSVAATAVLLALGGPVGRLVGTEAAPWAPPDQVLLQDDLTRIVGTLDPGSGPEVILMSAQTFYLLLPFYPQEREAAEFSADGRYFHFPYGQRRIVTTTAWDFTAPARSEGESHIANVIRDVDRAFPTVGLATQDPATLLVGGWRPAFVDELAALAERTSFLYSSAYVPGLFAYVLDVEALLEGFEDVEP